jgi:hypothetical protein
LANQATDIYATVSGGYGNAAGGRYAAVPGGSENLAAGDYSFAAGYRSAVDAAHDGTFLFADASGAEFRSVTANEFAVRATGGVRFVTAVGSDGAPAAGVMVAPGSGSWSSLCAREAKENVSAVDGFEILALLAGVPVSTWSYAGQSPAVRHIGPMAQDFYAAFHLGEDDGHISVVDADGVALAAVQGLYELVQEQEALIAAQQSQISALEARLAALEQTMSAGSRESGEPGP